MHIYVPSCGNTKSQTNHLLVIVVDVVVVVVVVVVVFVVDYVVVGDLSPEQHGRESLLESK